MAAGETLSPELQEELLKRFNPILVAWHDYSSGPIPSQRIYA